MIGLNFTAVTFCFWQCSCDLCSRNFSGRNWGYDFPDILGRRIDLDARLASGGPPLAAAYASPLMPAEEFFRNQVKQAGWKLLTVSNDGGVNTRDVAVCPDCVNQWHGGTGSVPLRCQREHPDLGRCEKNFRHAGKHYSGGHYWEDER